jgi:uncharacterized protein
MSELLTRELTAPAVNLESKPFFDAAAEGRFLIKRCQACGEAHWYPRTICPNCHSDRTVWEESKGLGVVYTYSIMRRASAPYAIGYVTLDEGPSMLTNFVGMAPEDLKIGMRVKVRLQATEGAPVPVFEPA